MTRARTVPVIDPISGTVSMVPIDANGYAIVPESTKPRLQLIDEIPAEGIAAAEVVRAARVERSSDEYGPVYRVYAMAA